MAIKGFKGAITTQNGITKEFDNIAVKGVIRASDLKKTVRLKSVNVVAYAGNIVIIGRNGRYPKETLLKIVNEAHKRRYEINQEKTKYVEVSKKNIRGTMSAIEIGNCKFEKA